GERHWQSIRIVYRHRFAADAHEPVSRLPHIIRLCASSRPSAVDTASTSICTRNWSLTINAFTL
ncbi:MAG TPA: hypothetical protein K8U85_03620, partial [Bifidobacterium animalis]|nr:hypothetical protein [Bifidobacterium animalis]